MKDQNDLKVMLSQWRTQFPNLYLRAVRGDCSVTVMTKANPLTVEDLDYIEKTYMPLPEVQVDEEALTSHMANFLTDFAELAEQAGMDDVAEELVVAAEEIKPKKERKERKARKSRNHPDNFPL